jgi:DNA-binding response OmpR family regulator
MNAVTIILVEDDDGHARLVEKNLRRAGISNPITRCADGESAVQCQQLGLFLAVVQIPETA